MNKDKLRKIRSGIEKEIFDEQKMEVRVVMPDQFLANLSTILKSQNSEILDLIREEKKLPELEQIIEENKRGHVLMERLEKAIKDNKVERVEIENFPEPKEVKVPEYPKEIDIKKPNWFEKFSDNRIVGILKDGFNGLAKQLNMDKYMDKKNALAVRLVDKTGKSFYDAVFSAISGGMPKNLTISNFPANYPSSEIDTNNTTNTPLGIDAVYTGTPVDCTGFSNVAITLAADVASAVDGMQFQFCPDTDFGADNTDTYSFNMSANGVRRFQFPVCARYFRVKYTNGGVAQTTFDIQTLLHRVNILTSIHRIDDKISTDRSAQIMKSVMSAKYNAQQSYTDVTEDQYDNLSITAWRELRTKDQRQLDLANCNDYTVFTTLGNDTANLADTVDHVFGTGAITFDKVNGAADTEYAGVQDTISSLNLTDIFEAGGFIGLGVKLPSIADVVNVFVRIGTDASNYNEWEWGVDGLTSGRWLPLRAATNQPDGYAGNGWNPEAVTYVAFGIEFSDEADTLAGIKFDNVHLVGGRVTDSTTNATITADINTPNINLHRVGGTPTDKNTGNSGTGTQRVVLASDQPTVAVSAASLPLPTGAATAAKQLADGHNVAINAALPAGTNAIGKLSPNSGVDIGDVDVTSQPARDRLTDNQGVALQTDAIMNDTTALTPKFAAISATTDNGNNTIVAAVTGYKIRVLACYLVSDADDTDVRWESAAGGTALSGAVPLLESTGYVLPFNPVGWFETDDGDDDLLNLEITGTGNVYGGLTYVLVPD